MKKYVFLILILAESSVILSQEYHKLINESMYWDESYAAMGYICSGYSESPPVRYSFNGDTLINGMLYARTYYSPFITWTPPINCGAFEVDTIQYLYTYAFLREDTIEQKVWVYEFYNNNEYLLYDFSLEQGDTLYFDSVFHPITIDTVYYITTDDGVVRKKLETNNYTGGYYIEGIGGVAGLFHHPYYYFEAGPWLMCVKDSNDNIILDIEGHCFDFITGTNTIHSKEGMKVYFDYKSDRTIIQLNNEIVGDVLILYNVSGQAVKKSLLEPNKREFEFTVSGLPAGLYVVVLFDAGMVVDKKKVVVSH